MALKRKTLFYYGLTDLPVTMSLFPALVFLPKFYTSDMAIPIALVGAIMLAIRISDVVTDPLFGYITDRFPTPWGRRRFWVALSTPIMMLSVYRLFMPPEGAGAWHMGIWMFTMSISTTMMLIPYYAWAAELSPDYNERSTITGVRSMMGVVGSLSAQLAPAGALLIFGIGGSAAVLEIVGVTMLVLMPICVYLTVTRVPEPTEYVNSGTPILEGLKLMVSNKPFLRLILAFMVSSTAFSITMPLYLFFITYVLHEEQKAIYMLTFFYLANLSAVPFWVWLSTRIGKHRAYVGSFVLIALAHPFYIFLGEGDFWYMLPISIVAGFAAGGFAALPNSMKADVIDLDTLRTGENRAALFFSTYSFTAKLSGSLGGSIGLFGLAFIGFNSVTPELNTPVQLFGLKFLFAVVPSIFFLGACAIIWRYPITEERHVEMRRELEAQNRSVALGSDIDS
ncbi:MAG: MFS transporter [Gammaproteobacteria bacterium]|jgi:glycoside/pentoside/hexuronide:cation symporter, GPH family|nr:MFS transporter [Gammaproteobacteria bacterium]MBT7369358.1 MFS transporter [Gammaproteobacteria bacterium]